jgi:adenylate cyclase class 2
MDTEFEAKFYPVDKDKYRQKLLSIGAKLVIPERKMRRVILDSVNHPEFRCNYIRVRDEGGVVRLSAKVEARADGRVADQKELDITVSDYDKTLELLHVMGYRFDNYQENLRETWEYAGAEIVIDTWPGLAPYSEIEADSENHVREIARILGLNWDKKIITFNLNVYMDVYRLDKKAVWEKMKLITFENNPFAGLPTFPIPNSQNT